MREPRSVVVVDHVDQVREPHLLRLFAHAWWTRARTPADVRRMLDGTDVVVGLVDAVSDTLEGFARAITDAAYLAVVLDVIVAPELRGTGLGARVMDEILARPELAGVDSVELVCQPDLVGFYELWGFTDRVGGSRLMRRTENPALGPGPADGAAPGGSSSSEGRCE